MNVINEQHGNGTISLDNGIKIALAFERGVGVVLVAYACMEPFDHTILIPAQQRLLREYAAAN